MHRIKANPAPTPDKAVFFKNAHDLPWDLIAVAAVLTPAPVVTLVGIYVDCDAVRVRALALGTIDNAPVKRT